MGSDGHAGNGSSYTNKTACELHSDCGINKYQKCHWNSTYVWTDTSSCSNHVDDTEDICIRAGTCADSDGVKGNGANYDNDEASCRAASDCGPPISNETCVWSPTNVWTPSNVTKDSFATELNANGHPFCYYHHDPAVSSRSFFFNGDNNNPVVNFTYRSVCQYCNITHANVRVKDAGSGYNYGDQLLFDDISSSDGDTKTIVPLTFNAKTGAAQYVDDFGTSVEGTYQNLIQKESSGYGTGASFDVHVDENGIAEIIFTRLGSGYAVGDDVVIDGSEFETMGYKVGSSDLRFIVPHSYSEKLIIFGGLSNTPRNDLFSYNYGSNEWHEVIVDGTSSPNPAQRYGHSAVIYKDFMFVFGGSTGNTLLNDLHRYRLKPGPFTKPSLLGSGKICKVHIGASVEYSRSYLEKHYKRLPARYISRGSSIEWTVDHVAKRSGMCNMADIGKCEDLCMQIKECNFFTVTSASNCCYIHKTCINMQAINGFDTYSMNKATGSIVSIETVGWLKVNLRLLVDRRNE